MAATSNPYLTCTARAIAVAALRESGGDLQFALALVSETAALFAARVSAGYMRLGGIIVSHMDGAMMD